MGKSDRAISASVFGLQAVNDDAFDVQTIPGKHQFGGKLLLLAIGVFPRLAEHRIDVVRTDQDGHDSRADETDDIVQTLQQVVGQITVDARVHQLVAVRGKPPLKRIDGVTSASRAVGDAVSGTKDDRASSSLPSASSGRRRGSLEARASEPESRESTGWREFPVRSHPGSGAVVADQQDLRLEPVRIVDRAGMDRDQAEAAFLVRTPAHAGCRWSVISHGPPAAGRACRGFDRRDQHGADALARTRRLSSVTISHTSAGNVESDQSGGLSRPPERRSRTTFSRVGERAVDDNGFGTPMFDNVARHPVSVGGEEGTDFHHEDFSPKVIQPATGRT